MRKVRCVVVGGQGVGAVRAANTSAVVRELRSGGPTSRATLARSTGLAKQTVSTIVTALIAEGVVREVGHGPPDAVSGGRPAVLLEYAADTALVAGVELGVGRTRVVLADALGQTVDVREVAVPPGPSRRRSPEAVLDAVVAALVAGAGDHGGAGLLRAVGVSVTGLVEPASGTCVLAPNLGWREVPVAALLRRRLAARQVRVPVVVRGAAQACLIAEHREGAATGQDDVVLLFEDEGIGAAVVEGGRLLDGADGTAGELGHCAWPESDEPCSCGRRGCVEVLASGPAVRRAVESAVGGRIRRPRGTPTLALLADMDGEAVETAAAGAGHVLGTAASWLVALTAPRVVVLSGAIVAAPRSYRAALQQAVERRALPRAPLSVVAGRLGEDAAVRGAVLLALDEARAATIP